MSMTLEELDAALIRVLAKLQPTKEECHERS